MRKDVVEAEEEDHQSWSKDEKNVHRIIREKSCKRGRFKISDDERSSPTHLDAWSWLSSARPPSFLPGTPRARLHRPLAASVGLSSAGTMRQYFACTKGFHAPEIFDAVMDGCFWMGTLLCSWWYSQLIILVSLMWPSIHPGFLMRLERSKSGFHLHQGWRVRAFMFYGFPRANLRWQDDGGRNRKPVHGTFSRDSKVTSTSPLSRLGP